jgi:uncharacterized membrane protein
LATWYNSYDMEILNSWQFHLIAYLVAVTVFFQFNRLAVRDAKDNAAATILLQIVAIATSIALVPFSPLTFPAQLGVFGLLALACLFYTFNDRLQTPVRKHLPVSTYTLLLQFTQVFLFIYGVVLFQEPFTLAHLLGVLMIIGANCLLLYKRGEFVMNKYMIFAIMAALSAATAISIDVGIANQFNLPLYIAITLTIPAILIMSAERVSHQRLKAEYKNSTIKWYLITGVAWAASIYFGLRSLQLGEMTTVVPLQALSVLLNVIVAYIFLKERQQMAKKLIASLFVIIGVVSLSL